MIHEVDWEGGSKTTWKYSTFICFYLFLLKGSFTTTKSSVLKYFNILFTIVKFPYCGGGHIQHTYFNVGFSPLKYFFVLSYVYATMQCVLCHNLFIKNIHFINYNFIYILNYPGRNMELRLSYRSRQEFSKRTSKPAPTNSLRIFYNKKSINYIYIIYFNCWPTTLNHLSYEICRSHNFIKFGIC